MIFEDNIEPKLFWANDADRRPTGEFPPLTAADVEQLKSADGDCPEGEDWLKTALFKTSKVQPMQPPKDLASSIALSVQPTGEHPKSSANPPIVLRPTPSAALPVSFLDSVRSMARPIAAVALGLMVTGAVVVFFVSRNTTATEAASSEGAVVAERPPLAPALIEELPSSGSLDLDEIVDVEQTTTTVEAATSTTKAKTSGLSEKTRAEQTARTTTTTTQPPSAEAPITLPPTTEAPTTLPPTTEATTTQPPTTQASTTEAPTTQTSTTVEDKSNSVD